MNDGGRRYELAGWALFAIGVLLFLLQGVQTGSTLIIGGSVLFLAGIVAFLVPLIRNGKT